MRNGRAPDRGRYPYPSRNRAAGSRPVVMPDTSGESRPGDRLGPADSVRPGRSAVMKTRDTKFPESVVPTISHRDHECLMKSFTGKREWQTHVVRVMTTSRFEAWVHVALITMKCVVLSTRERRADHRKIKQRASGDGRFAHSAMSGRSSRPGRGWKVRGRGPRTRFRR